MRWLEDDGRVSVFRMPTNYSNGNTFDFQGRQVSCEHLGRRVIRYELDGSAHRHRRQLQRQATQFAQRRRGSSRRQSMVYRSALWRPALRGRARTRLADRPINQGTSIPSLANLPDSYQASENYRPTAIGGIRAESSIIVVTEEQVPDPNGLCFSPDYKRLYVISTGKGPGDTGPGGKGDVSVFDVGADNKLSNQKLFTDCVVDGVKCGPDGIRADVDGNLWVSSNAGRAVGYNGVTVWNPAGKLIGRIRTPEVVANICFGGPKRNRLFMAGSQSLYALFTATQGAAPG